MTALVLRQRAQGTGAAEHGAQPGKSNDDGQAMAIYLISAVQLGTGGVPAIDWSRANARTGPFTIVREGDAESAFTTADRVLLLRRWLSLSIAEAARALHVQRPTIYSWQDGKVSAAPKNLDRLRTVFDLAREWRERSSEPVGNHRKEPLGPRGRTLMDLLAAEEIQHAHVLETLNRIAEVMARARARRPMPGAELAKRFGFHPVDEAEFVSNLARESTRGSAKKGAP